MPALLHPNLAADKAIQKRITEELVPLVRHVRRDRKTLREQWLRFGRIWGAIPDQESYHGRIQTYLPVVRRSVETWTQRISRDLFPSEDWFAARALRESLERRTPIVKALFQYFFTTHMRLRRHAKPWVRQLCTLGTSPVACTWRVEEEAIPVLRDLVAADGEAIGMELVEEKVLRYLGPTFQPIDLHAWYAWPVTVTDVDDLTLHFEDLLLSESRLKLLSRTPVNAADPDLGMLYDPKAVKQLLEQRRAKDQRDRVEAERRRLSDKGFQHPLDASLPEPLQPFDVTQCLWRTDLEDPGISRQYLVCLGADDLTLRVQRNPWWHQRSPYLVGKFTEVINEFYGRSLIEQVDKLQYFVNDVANQSSDALVWSLNPVTIVDMFKVQDLDSIRMRPGAKWIAEPSGVNMLEPPKESVVAGFGALSQLTTSLREFSEPAPLPVAGAGRSRGRALQTSAGMQLALAEAATPVRDVVEAIEDQVFVPMLRHMHALTLQCLDRDLVLQITGVEGAPLVEQRVTVADVVGDFEFRWLGSTNAQNQQVRAQQMINFLAIATKIPPQVLDQDNVRIRVGNLLRAIYAEGMQLPNADRIIAEKVKQTSIDPRIENDLFRLGRGADVPVSEADDDAGHLKVHRPLLDNPALDPWAAELLAKHIRGHEAATLAKQVMRMQQQASQAGLQAAAQGSPRNGGGGPGGNGRLASTSGVDDLFRSLPRTGP